MVMSRVDGEEVSFLFLEVCKRGWVCEGGRL